jgi:creatinine amidohydrolase/Fe(II)-dependent formamide hydrolase-like protein
MTEMEWWRLKAAEITALAADVAIGDPRSGSAEKGERLLDVAAAAVAAVLVNGEFWTLPA